LVVLFQRASRKSADRTNVNKFKQMVYVLEGEFESWEASKVAGAVVVARRILVTFVKEGGAKAIAPSPRSGLDRRRSH